MAKVVVGMFDQIENAHDAVGALVDSGFPREDISLVAGDEAGNYKRYVATEESMEDVGSGAATGAGVGAVLGGLGGLLVGLGALAIPGIGPVVAAGPLVSALAGAGIGAAAGGLIGALSDLGIPEEQARTYAEGVRRGATLVTLTVSDDRASEAVQLMNRFDPVDVNRRSAEWGQDWQTMHPETHAEIDEPVAGRTDWDRDLQSSINQPMTGQAQPDRDLHSRIDMEDARDAALDQELDPIRTGDEGKTMEVEDDLYMGKHQVDEEIYSGYEHYDPMFRSHFDMSYSHLGSTYEDFRPAYTYGYDLANDPRYRGRDWNQVEMDARRDWETVHADRPWDDVKDAIRRAWDTVTGQR